MKTVTALAVWFTFTSAVLADSQPETGEEEYTSPSDFSVYLEAHKVHKRDVNSDYSEGCHRNGELIPVGETYTDQSTCMEFLCEKTQHGRWIYFELKLSRGACGRHEGSCMYKDEQVQDGCSTYQCFVELTEDGSIRSSKRPVSGGCRSFSSQDCIGVNSTIEINCQEYMCTATDLGDGRTRYSLGISRGSCGRQDGKCLFKDEQFKQGCSTYQCFVDVLENGKTRASIRPVSGGCRSFDSKCIEVNAKIEMNCQEYQCTATDLGSGRTRYTLGPSRGSCGLFDGQCVYENQTIFDGCTRKICRHNGDYYGYDLEIKCQDASGQCHEPSTTGTPTEWFDIERSGRVIKNCGCTTLDSNGVRYICR